MSSRRSLSSVPPHPVSTSRLEYRAPADDAWYSVRLVMQDAALRVMYEDFQEEVDEWYEAGQFATAAEVEELRARFRARSPPLEDSQCRTVGRGTAVCVSCPLQGGDLEGGELKFFDAVIDSVSSAHEYVDGEDRCHCKFLVVWKDGPHAGSRSEVSIEQICYIPNLLTEDPILSEFFDSAFKLLENKGNGKARSVSLATPVHEMQTSSHQEVYGSEDSSLPNGRFSGGTITAENNNLTGQWVCQETRNMSYFFVRVENLENDLLPTMVTDFIYQKISIRSQVILHPGLFPDSYSEGYIFVKTKELAQTLLAFLSNPAHIVVSPKGRPLVLQETKVGEMKLSMKFVIDQPIDVKEHSSELRLVYIGSKEYAQAKEMLNQHKEFHDHVRDLRKQMEQDDRKLQNSGTADKS